MMSEVRDEVIAILSRMELRMAEPDPTLVRRPVQQTEESREDPAMAGMVGEEPQPQPQQRAAARPVVNRAAAAEIDPNDPSTWGKVPRNAACPCQSGKKYKHCHGRLA